MFQAINAISKAKKSFLNNKKVEIEEESLPQQDESDSVRTLEQMAKDEKKNKDILPDKQFFGKLNDIFQKYLGHTIRRELNYFQSSDLVEQDLLQAIGILDEEELLEFSIKILRKDIIKRTFEEIVILEKVMEHVLPISQIRISKGRQVLFDCIKNLKYKYGKAGTLLQKQGDPIKCFYIILKGLIQIKQQIKNDDNVEDFDSPSSLKKKSFIKRASRIQIMQKGGFNENVEAQNRQKVIYLNKGMCYGENQLFLNEEQLADNQAYLFDNCHLAYIDIQKFRTIIEQSTLYKVHEEIKEFSHMNVIKTMNQKSIQQIYLRTSSFSLLRNNILTKEGDQVDFIYFIREGEIKLSKKLVYEENKNKQTQLAMMNSFQANNMSIAYFDLAILSKGQFLGLSEYFNDKMYSATCTIYSTSATFYKLSKTVTHFQVVLYLLIFKKDLENLLQQNEEMNTNLIELFQNDNPESQMMKVRVSQFNQVVGKVDLKTKELLEQNQTRRSDKDILKNLSKGASMMIRSSVNIGCGRFQGMTNFDFIKSSLKQAKEARRNKMNKQTPIIRGCQFSQNDLEHINKTAYHFRRSLDKLPPPSPMIVPPRSHSPKKNFSVCGSKDIPKNVQSANQDAQTDIFNKEINSFFPPQSKEQQEMNENSILHQSVNYKESHLFKQKDINMLRYNQQEVSRDLDLSQSQNMDPLRYLNNHQNNSISSDTKRSFVSTTQNTKLQFDRNFNNSPEMKLNITQYKNNEENSRILNKSSQKSFSCHHQSQTHLEGIVSPRKVVLSGMLSERRYSSNKKEKRTIWSDIQSFKKQKNNIPKLFMLMQSGERQDFSEERTKVEMNIEDEEQIQKYSHQQASFNYLKGKQDQEKEVALLSQQISPNSQSSYQIKNFSSLPMMQQKLDDSSAYMNIQSQILPFKSRNIGEMAKSQSHNSTSTCFFQSGFYNQHNNSNNNTNNGDPTMLKRNQTPNVSSNSSLNQKTPSNIRNHSFSFINKFLPLKYNAQTLVDPKEKYLSPLCKERQARARQSQKKQKINVQTTSFVNSSELLK